VLSILLALLAAFLFAVGLVFQQKAAMEEPGDEALKAGFLLKLLRQPVWLLGFAGTGLAYVAQAAALGVGRLVVVQPILVASVVFALPLGVRFTGQKVGRREVIGAIAVTGGIAAFLLISAPSGGRDDAPLRQWLIAGGILGAAAAILVVLGMKRRPGIKAALFGTAAGVLFGLTSALTKATVDRLDGGVGALVGNWHLYALIVVSVVGFALLQAALQAGALAPAIATLMAFETIVGGAIGIVLFQEQIRTSPVRIVGSVIALAVTLAGLIVLAGSEAHAVEHSPAGTVAEPTETVVEPGLQRPVEPS
jgi:uncharacterized membrane protein